MSFWKLHKCQHTCPAISLLYVICRWWYFFSPTICRYVSTCVEYIICVTNQACPSVKSINNNNSTPGWRRDYVPQRVSRPWPARFSVNILNTHACKGEGALFWHFFRFFPAAVILAYYSRQILVIQTVSPPRPLHDGYLWRLWFMLHAGTIIYSVRRYYIFYIYFQINVQ